VENPYFQWLLRRGVFPNLAHASGDAIKAVLAAAGYNFCRLLAYG
jgi:hypothetical protein